MKKSASTLAILLVASAASAAPQSMSVACHTLPGAARKISLKASLKDNDDAGLIHFMIDGRRGLIDMNQESNDMNVSIGIVPSKKEFSAMGDLTSDDSFDAHANVDAKPETIELAVGSTDDVGSATFKAIFGGEIYHMSTKLRSVKSQVVSCKASWK